MPVYLKPLKLIMRRDFTVRTTTGNTIIFKGRKPVHVPSSAIEECMKHGAYPESEEELESVEAPKVAEIPQGAERHEAIIAAIEAIVARNQRGDFTANNSPHTKAISKIVDFEVTARERNDLWDRVIQKSAKEKSN